MSRRRLRIDAPSAPPLREFKSQPVERAQAGTLKADPDGGRGGTFSGDTTEESRDDYSAPSGQRLALDASAPVVFHGFADEKLRAPLKLGSDGLPTSAKYTFAKLAMTSNTMPLTAAQAEDWFNTHIREGMEAKGFRVGWVRGDQALIGTRENPQGELILFLRGAGSPNPAHLALIWENEATQAREQEVTELGDGPNDPLLKVQAEIAKSLAREEQRDEVSLERDLRKRLRANRIPNKG